MPEEDPAIRLAEWLHASRENLRLSAREVADKTGMSIEAIYRIERGQTTNPRRRTLERLENVLGSMDQAEKEAIEKEANVEGLGEFTEFDPYDDEDVPDEAGVYVFYDISDRPIYVGMGNPISGRVREHAEKFWFKEPIVVSGAYIAIGETRMRRQVETILIKFLKSNAVLNKQNVDREE